MNKNFLSLLNKKPRTRVELLSKFDDIFNLTQSNIATNTSKIDFDFSKILILNKITRYEFEKKKNPNLSEQELKSKLQKRGSNFERLVEHHNTHYRSLEKILKAFKAKNIETRVTQRFNYSNEEIDWSNCIFSAGGDGTFLLAAAKINSYEKPVIGVNTDVTSSEGHLLIPKDQSINFPQTLDKLLKGDFRWLSRARIRIHLETQTKSLKPIELHDQVLHNLEHRYIEHVEESRKIKLENSNTNHANTSENKFKQVPTLALNEVFIGESLSARVSYYLMSIDNGPLFRQKSSGIIICTGTGSTSWCYNINKMSVQSMKKIINLVKENLNLNSIPAEDDKFVSDITNQFNDSIVFEPDQLRMAYTIRDPIINRIFKNETNRGFAEKLIIQSRCFDACLVIDGSQSYQFNDGSKAMLEILPEDSLKTVLINKD